MFRSADIHINRQPCFHFFASANFCYFSGQYNANNTKTNKQKCPLYLFPFGFCSTLWTFYINEFFRMRQRRLAFFSRQIIFNIWQFYRQIFLRHRYNSAFIAINYRNRRAPVSLTGNQPIAKLIIYFTTTDFFLPAILPFFRALPAKLIH